MGTKNITLSLPENVARWLRIWAAENDSSVSKMLAELLKEKMDADKSYDQAMHRFLKTSPKRLKSKGRYPRRSELYE